MVALVGAAVLLDLAGVAGYRSGLVLVAVPMVLGPVVAAWALARRSGSWTVWALAGAVAGLCATAVLGARAPYSEGELVRRMDDLDLPFFEVARQQETGSSWCRPDCPAVERTYEVPDVGVQSTMVTVGLALVRADLVEDRDLPQLSSGPFLRVRSSRLTVEVHAEEADDGTLRAVRIRYAAARPG